MAGVQSGVASRITASERRALFSHCYGHSLNLATQDTLKAVKIIGDCLDTVYEITKLIKKSPKREGIFNSIKDDISNDSPGIRVLCPTRWAVKAEALASISENYRVLQLTWESAKDATTDTEMKARILGVASQMEKFDFFAVELGRKILCMVDNLSRSLQAKLMSACEGQKLVQLTLSALMSLRTDEQFSLFWQYVEKRRSINDLVCPPELPRHRKVPRRFEVGSSISEQQNISPEDHYRHIYFQALDTASTTITDRFNQRGYQMLQKLESVLLLDDASRHPLFEEIIQFYGSDFDSADRLTTQLHILISSSGIETQRLNLQSIITYIKTLTPQQKEYFSEVTKILKLILLMPATNATSERCFSALRRLKTWLRTTTSQQIINWCMILHVHKDRTDKLSITEIADEFITRNQSRIDIFGLFK